MQSYHYTQVTNILQCQVQGVTGLEFCYFFVWTPHGFVIEKIQFDLEHRNNLKNEIVRFNGALSNEHLLIYIRETATNKLVFL